MIKTSLLAWNPRTLVPELACKQLDIFAKLLALTKNLTLVSPAFRLREPCDNLCLLPLGQSARGFDRVIYIRGTLRAGGAVHLPTISTQKKA